MAIAKAAEAERLAKKKLADDAKAKAAQIKEAERKAEAARLAALPKLLGDTKCFQMTLTNPNGETFAMAMSQQDLYHPKKTGVFAAYAGKFSNTEKS